MATKLEIHRRYFAAFPRRHQRHVMPLRWRIREAWSLRRNIRAALQALCG